MSMSMTTRMATECEYDRSTVSVRAINQYESVEYGESSSEQAPSGLDSGNHRSDGGVKLADVDAFTVSSTGHQRIRPLRLLT